MQPAVTGQLLELIEPPGTRLLLERLELLDLIEREMTIRMRLLESEDQRGDQGSRRDQAL